MTDEGIPSVTDLPKTSPEIAANYSRSAIQEGDIVMSIGPSFGKVAMARAEHNGANLTQGTARIAIAEEHLARYFFWLLRSSDIHQYWTSIATGATFPALNLEPLGSTVVPIPSYKEQQKIAAYLDHTTSLIDQLIEKNTALLELLDQQRKALINEAVTKGLDPKAKMKESGIGWLGEVPEHWSVLPLRTLGTLQNGVSASAEYFGEGSPFVSYGDVYRNVALPEHFQGRARSTQEDQDRYSLFAGDVLFTRTSETIDEIGIASTCLRDIPEAVFAGFLIRFRPDAGKLFPGFSKYYFRSKGVREFLASEVNLVTRASLSQELLKRLPVCLPPFEEQGRLAEQINERVSRIDSLEQMVRESIDKLAEYRQSIISEAVTGKMDLREWEPAAHALQQEPKE